jgi:DNA-binding SARP family transcriptional activator
MIELRTLGTLQLISADRRPVDSVLAQPRRTALLCYLALAAPRGFQSRDTLYALFWPEHGARQAKQALRQATYFLRRALGAGAIVSRGDGALAISPDLIRCDAWEFEEALVEGRAEDALSLYQGDLLGGFHISEALGFERWLDERRTGLRQRAVDAAWTQSEAQERTGNGAAAAEWARRAVALCPADETMLRRQLLLLDRLSDRGAALRAYQKFASTLEREYELQPSAETRALVTRICAPDEDVAAATSSIVLLAGAESTSTAFDLPARVAASHTRPDKSPAAPQARRRVVVYAGLALLLATVVVLVAVPPFTSGIARAVVRELGTGTPTRNVTSAPVSSACSKNPAARESYQRGIRPELTRTDSGWREAATHIKRAIDLDSTCAPAWAALALHYLRGTIVTPQSDRQSPEQRRALAKGALQTALEFDANTAEAHLWLGLVLATELEFAEAEKAMHRAFHLDSTLERAPLIHLYIFTRRQADALAEAKRWMQRDSADAYANAEYAHALLANDRCDEALQILERLTHLDPPLLRAAPYAAQCYVRKQMLPEALQALEIAKQERGPRAQALTGFIQARSGNSAGARRVLADLLVRWNERREGAFNIAVLYAGLSDPDSAFVWLNKSFDDRALAPDGLPARGLMVVPDVMGPLFDELRHDRRFDHLMDRLGISNR